MANVRRSSLVPVNVGSIYISELSRSGLQEATIHPQQLPTDTTSSSDSEKTTDEDGNLGNSRAVTATGREVRNSSSNLSMIRIKQQRRNRARRTYFVANCLRHVLTLLYYAGLSSVKLRPLPKTYIWIQKIQMWITLAVSLLYSVSSAKTNWIYFRSEPSKLQFLYFGVCLVAIMTRLHCIRVFACRSKSVKTLLKRIDHLNAASTRLDSDSTETNHTWAKMATTLVVLVSISTLMSTSIVLFGRIPAKRWSFQTQQLVHAYETGEFLLIWSSNNLENETDLLAERYATNMTVATASLAVTGNIVTFIGSLHENLMLDFWAIMAMQLYAIHRSLHSMLQDLDNEDFLDSGQWNLYLNQREVCDEINEIYGKLLVFVHVQNTILISYTMLTIFNKAAISAEFVVRILNVAKILVTYNYIQKTSDTNTELKEAIMRKCMRQQEIFVDGKNLSVSLLLEDIRSHPIGLGRGEYHVNDSFIAKMLGAAASIFVVLMDALK